MAFSKSREITNGYFVQDFRNIILAHSVFSEIQSCLGITGRSLDENFSFKPQSEYLLGITKETEKLS